MASRAAGGIKRSLPQSWGLHWAGPGCVLARSCQGTEEGTPGQVQQGSPWAPSKAGSSGPGCWSPHCSVRPGLALRALAGCWAQGQFSGHPASWGSAPCGRRHSRFTLRHTGFTTADTLLQVLCWACVQGDSEAPGVRPGSLGGPKLGPLGCCLSGGWGLAFQAGTRPMFPALRRPPGGVEWRWSWERHGFPAPSLPGPLTLACHPKASGLCHERGLSPAAQEQLWSWGRVILVGLCQGLSGTGSGPTDHSWPTDVFL